MSAQQQVAFDVPQRVVFPATFSAFVLAGGASSRMGTDKAMLQMGGDPLIARAVRQLRRLTPSVFIVGNRPELARYAPVVYDKYPNGALGAIVTALETSPAAYALTIAVDLPLVTPEWLLHLVSKADHHHAPAVISTDGNHLQPLCAVYSRNLLPSLKAQIAAGEDRVIEAVMAATAGRPEVLQPDDVTLLRNVNTPEDMERVRALHG